MGKKYLQFYVQKDSLNLNPCIVYQHSQGSNSYEPVHEISNMVCTTIKASDQPAHTRSLIRAFAICLSIL